MSAAPGTKCGQCSREVGKGSADGVGWLRHAGESIGGKPLDLWLCPACRGLGTPKEDVLAEVVEVTGWFAECDTCDADIRDEWTNRGRDVASYTREEAEKWAELHECESNAYAVEPGENPHLKKRKAS